MAVIARSRPQAAEAVVTDSRQTFVLTKLAKDAISRLREHGAEREAIAGISKLNIDPEALKELRRYGDAILKKTGDKQGARWQLVVKPEQIAPETAPGREVRRRGPRKAQAEFTPDVAFRSNTAQYPKVEELLRLLGRIETEERQVNATLGSDLNHQIAVLKRKVADTAGDDFERVLRELNSLVDMRKNLSRQVRIEAFKIIDADGDFSERKYLKLLSIERE